MLLACQVCFGSNFKCCLPTAEVIINCCRVNYLDFISLYYAVFQVHTQSKNPPS